MTITTDQDMNRVHKLYLKHLQNLEGDMVDNGYDHTDVIKVCTLFIHSVLHNKDIDYKLEAYYNLANHFLGVIENLNKNGTEIPK